MVDSLFRILFGSVLIGGVGFLAWPQLLATYNTMTPDARNMMGVVFMAFVLFAIESGKGKDKKKKDKKKD